MPTFERRLAWLPWAGAAVVGMLLLPAVWYLESIRALLLLGIAIALGGGSYFLCSTFRSKSRYDLSALREVHDRETVRQLLEEEQPVNPDFVHCLGCHEEYASHLPTCPRCGRKSAC